MERPQTKGRGKVTAALIFIAIAIQGCQDALHPGADHHVEIDYKCMHWKDNMCQEWRAHGLVTTRKNAFCLPGDATVVTRQGAKPMASIRLGDELMSFNHATGKTEFSAVRAWLHRETNTVVKMIRVQTERGDVVVSPDHSLAVSGGRQFAFARDLVAGDILIAPDGISSVQKITWEDATGLFAPLTWSSNFFVGQGKNVGTNAMILAHSFAVVPYPQWFAAPFHSLLSMWEVFNPAIHDFDETSNDVYLHPICRKLMGIFGISVLDDPIHMVHVDRIVRPEFPAQKDASTSSSLRNRRLYGTHSTSDHPRATQDSEEELSDYLQAVIDHPPFMFDNTYVPPSTNKTKRKVV